MAKNPAAWFVGAPLLLLVVLFSGCSGSAPDNRLATDARPAVTRTSESASAEVTRAMFGEQWPLTVDSGIVERIPLRAGGKDLSLCIFRAPDGKVYGLNGTATGRGYAEIRPIWRDHPDPRMSGIKVDIGPLIQFALNLR